MPAASLSLAASIEIDGAPLPDQLVPLIEQIVVDDYLHLPDMFVLAFRDVDRTVLAQAKLKIGSRLKVSATSLGSSVPEPLIVAEVTTLEGEYGPSGQRAIVRGYDLSHRLHRGRRTETYHNVTDSDIAQTIARRAQIPVGTIDPTRVTHDHVSQANSTDWEFLVGRAAEIGYEVSVSDGKFSFREPTPSSDAPSGGDFNTRDPLQLVMGQELLEFRPRLSSAAQVKEVQVRGWEMGQKRGIVATAPAATTSARLAATPAALAQKFGDPLFVSVDRGVATQAAADTAAKAIAEQIGSTFAEADGVARGNPRLRAGAAVSIGVVGDEFTGQYTLTQTRHVFDPAGYRTQFVVSGRQERSLLGLAGGGNGASAGGSRRIEGVVIALVTNNEDPEELGRVKLKFPWLSDTYESDWARMAQLGAGPRSGAVFLPEVNDEVLVAFEFGDVSRPFVVGGLYNGVDKPRLGDGLFDNGAVKRRGFVSRKGHRIVFLDGPDKSGIALLSSDDKLRIAIKESGTEIEIGSDGKIAIDARQEITIKSSSSITVEAQANLTLKGSAGVSIEAGGNVAIKGATVQLN